MNSVSKQWHALHMTQLKLQDGSWLPLQLKLLLSNADLQLPPKAVLEHPMHGLNLSGFNTSGGKVIALGISLQITALHLYPEVKFIFCNDAHAQGQPIRVRQAGLQTQYCDAMRESYVRPMSEL